MSTAILLTTLNAKYQHSSFGLRYLFANLGELQTEAKLLEFTIHQNPRDIAESILMHQPKIVGMGVYIWNVNETYEVVSILKRVSPKTIIVLGGPEVSHETDTQAICHLADYTIRGEADILFSEFCRKLLTENTKPTTKWVSGDLPKVKELLSPYPYYSDEDIKNRVIYVEASRGCPYRCEYCLSSLDQSVRSFDLNRFLSDMDQLILRGARQFKFVDRTFNLSISTSTQILQFFLNRMRNLNLNPQANLVPQGTIPEMAQRMPQRNSENTAQGLFLHFEMVPDRLPLELRELICKFPDGSLQFEVGIQTWNPAVARTVSRRQDYSKIVDHFSFLTQETGVHLHADLIAGLPGETLDSFAHGFDSVFELGAEEIQVGILKRLKGTPIIRHNEEYGMVYEETPPFQVLQTKAMSFQDLQDVGRFAKFWNLYVNSGNFKSTMELFQLQTKKQGDPSLFRSFLKFTRYLFQRHPQMYGVALLNLVESAWLYFTETLNFDPKEVRTALIEDYAMKGKRDIPSFLRTQELQELKEQGLSKRVLRSISPSSTPKRQLRHQL